MNPISGFNSNASLPLTFANSAPSAIPQDVLSATGNSSGALNVNNMITLLTQLMAEKNAAASNSAPLTFNNAATDASLPSDVRDATGNAGNAEEGDESQGSEGSEGSEGSDGEDSGSEGAE